MSTDLDLMHDIDSAWEDAVRLETATSFVAEALSWLRPVPVPDSRRSPAAPVKLGETIRSLRRRAKLTSAAVARAAKLQPSNYSRLERGSHSPSLATLNRVAAALKVPVSELLATVPSESRWTLAPPERVVVKRADLKRIEETLRSPPRAQEALRDAFAAHRRR